MKNSCNDSDMDGLKAVFDTNHMASSTVATRGMRIWQTRIEITKVQSMRQHA